MLKESKTYKNMPKKIYIRTYGCQMNVYDSEIMAGILASEGFEIVFEETEADIILLNTCSVRELAEKKVFGKLGELNKLRREEDLILGVCGCMSQNLKDEIFKRAPFVDVVCGTHQINNIGNLLRSAIEGKGKAVSTLSGERPLSYKTRFGVGTLTAYVAIMRGCDNYCTYCIVPYVRGKEVSRPLDEVIEEVKMLADSGCREITLLGQNVNSYGKSLSSAITFVDLLQEVNEISGIERIRFITSHPKDAGDELFYAIRDLNKVCEYLHLPLQAGSNAVLKLMNRGYTKEDYKEKVYKLREIVPGIALSTDIIVGFPYEEDQDFQETLAFMQEIKYESAFIFKYSIRSKTKAALMLKQVDQKVKEERHKILLDVQEKISLESNLKAIGGEVEVLVEDFSKRNKARLFGRTLKNKIAVFAGREDLIGKIVKLKIVKATSHTLYGELL